MGLRLQFSTGPWEQVWRRLVRGEVDVLPLVARLPGRESAVDFSIPHTETFDAFFVREGRPAPHDIEAARGLSIVVMRSDAAHGELLARGFHDLVTVETIPDGLALLAAGRHDALLCSKVIGSLEIREHAVTGLVVGPPVPDYKRAFSFAVHKGQAELLEKLNQGLLIVKTNGVYDRIYARWLSAEEPWWRSWRYVGTVLFTTAVVAVAAAALAIVLQWLVRRRTQQLARANRAVESEVAERRKAEAALQDMNQSLEGRVAERTAALQASEARYRSLFDALKRNEALLRAVLDNSPDPIFLKDREGRLILGNRATLGIIDAPADQAVGKTDLELYDDPDTGRAIMANDRRIMDSGQMEVVEETVASPSGTRTYLSSKAPFRDESGELMGVVGVARDITERKRAEEALRESEHRFRLALRNAPVSVAVQDGNLRYLWAYNQRSARPGDIIGKTDADLFLPEEAERLRVIKRRVLDERVEVREQMWLDRLGGRMFLDLYFEPILDDAGNAVAVGIATVDLTPMKSAEEAVREANDRLAEADRRKNEFLGVLSHELRNPLASISTALYVLDHAAAAGEQAGRAKAIIGRQVTHLSNLIDDLLDVTRITRGKVQLQKASLDLDDVVSRTVEDNRALFESAGVSLDWRPSVRRLSILADRTRVSQIVGNLLQNAAKFTPTGGHTRVTAEADGAEAVLRVSDDGAGMSAVTLGQLFQPFVQAEQTLDRSQGGLGLGLALVKGLVELHGGRIHASSGGVGRGAEFEVRFPLQEAASSSPGGTRPLPAAGPRDILLVEDNADAAEGLRAMLDLAGHHVRVAPDGAQGLALARASRPDVVFCDIGLPVMDGYQVARAFRADPVLRSTFLVAISGYARPEDRQLSASAGFDRHVAKPPTMEVIEELLASAPVAGSASSSV